MSSKKGRINRSKGHNAERIYRKIFIELGFKECVTSRYGSRIHDDAGVDLINLPINVQIKAGKQRNLNKKLELEEIKSKIKKLIPNEQEKPLILIHRKDVMKGKRRTEFDDLVTLTFNDFKKIFNTYVI